MHKSIRSILLLPAAWLLIAPAARAEQSVPPPSTEPAAQRDARMAWFRDARFGMFIHWGLYSGLEGEHKGKPVDRINTEWHQMRADLDTDTYATLAKPKFKPAPDCAKAWAKLAKEAGCKYIVLTTKHHEGFDLFESKYSEYTAKEFVGRDMVREYVDATRAEGLRVGFYHSLIDWHHAEYDFRKAKGLPYSKGAAKLAGDKPRDQIKYIEFLHNQVLNELLSNYGKIDELWFDFSSDQFAGDEAWGGTTLLRNIRTKQPGIVVNNRLFPFKQSATVDPRHGDFMTPEQHIPANGMPGVDFEVCMTINDTWGYSKFDKRWKSSQNLIRNLCDIASKGGNFLLNIGPKGDGSIPPETVERMQSIGRWMKVNADAIYGTVASPFVEKFPWGRVTRKGDTLYLLVFERPQDGVITLQLANGEGASAKLLADGTSLKTESSTAKLTLTLPDKLPDVDASVVAVKLTGAPVVADHQ